MIILGTILALFAVFLLIVGCLAWSRRLPGNNYIGIRVPEVRKSKESWDLAHQFAGPLWVASGVTMAIASVPPFSGISWLLLISVIALVAAIYFFGLGASIGARAAGALENSSGSERDGCCGGTQQPEPDQAAESRKEFCGSSNGDCGSCTTHACETASAIDLEALKRAAQSADKQ